MSEKFGLGWDVFQAVNGQSPVVLPDPGGRWLGIGLPYFCANQFLAGNNAAYVSYATEFMVNACRWLLGGRSVGTILVSDTTADFSWYGQTTGSQLVVGSTVRDALTAAGFTITTYTGPNAAPAAIGNCDIVILGAEGQFGPYSPSYATQKTDLVNWVTNDGGAVMDIGFGYHACTPASQTPFLFTSSYAVFAGPHNPAFIYNFTGAEALFGDVAAMPQFGDSYGGIDAEAFRTYIYWGGSIGCSAGSGGYSYPDGIHCLWDFDSTFAQNNRPGYHNPVVAAYTQYSDAGNGNKAW